MAQEVNPHVARKEELELKQRGPGLDETETEELRRINEHLASLEAKPAQTQKEAPQNAEGGKTTNQATKKA